MEASDDEYELSPEQLELLAVVRGLEALPQPSRVTLVTGSRYVSLGLRFGLSEWRENGWQWEHFGQMLPVKNAELWKRVDQAVRIHDVQFRTLRIDGPHLADHAPVGTTHFSRRKELVAGGECQATQDPPACRRIAAEPETGGWLRRCTRTAARRVREWWQNAPLRAAQLI